MSRSPVNQAANSLWTKAYKPVIQRYDWGTNKQCPEPADTDPGLRHRYEGAMPQ